MACFVSAVGLVTGDADGGDLQGVFEVIGGESGGVQGDAGSAYALGYVEARGIYRAHDLATKQRHEILFDALEQFGVEIPGCIRCMWRSCRWGAVEADTLRFEKALKTAFAVRKGSEKVLVKRLFSAPLSPAAR